MARTFFARAIVAILLGIAVGYAVGKSTAHDAAEARQLTLKQYVADFEQHKQKLMAGNVSMAAGLVGGVIVVVVLLGVYELLVWACDRLLALIDRRKKDAVYPGTPPPW